jgi:hypothetical protein
MTRGTLAAAAVVVVVFGGGAARTRHAVPLLGGPAYVAYEVPVVTRPVPFWIALTRPLQPIPSADSVTVHDSLP